MRVCSVSGCPTIYAGTDSRCATHAKVADRQHWAKTRAYNTKGHRKVFRPGVLARDPICVLCEVRVSVVADHFPLGRDELIEQGLNPDDPQHGRGLCPGCDKKQSAVRQPGGWNLR